jgi:hypothetical protein
MAKSTPPAQRGDHELHSMDITDWAPLSVLELALGEGRDDTAASVVDELLNRDDDQILPYVFGLFDARDRPLPRVVNYLASPRVRVRYYAADHYGKLPHHFADRAADLQPTLHDSDPSVVAAAVWALGRLDDRAAVPWITPLLRHGSEDVRATAAPALLALRSGVDELVAVIRDGAGDVSLSLLMALWPQLTPALRVDLSPAVLSRLATTVPLAELLQDIGVAATDKFVMAHATELHGITMARASAGEVIYALAMKNRWPVTFADEYLALASPVEAAAWWEIELRRRCASHA